VLTPSIDIANARLIFEGGAVANLTASRVSTERMRKLRIFQRSGYLSLNLGDGIGEFLRLKRDLPSFLDGAGGVPTPIASDIRGIVERIPLSAEPVEPLRRQLESFRDAILSHRPPPVTGREGRDALATALAIEDRIKSHVTHTSSP
jgi:predicted dehydrogenase